VLQPLVRCLPCSGSASFAPLSRWVVGNAQQTTRNCGERITSGIGWKSPQLG
jgi:hypothetical protein